MSIGRRELIAAGAVTVFGGHVALADEGEDILRRRMPTRVLGRTKARVSVIGLGSAPMGHSFQPQDVFDRVVGEALDLGVNYIDTATIYDAAQVRLGPIVRRHRDRMFLVTKTRGMSKDAALKTIEESLRLLQTDRVDLVHLHNIGDFDTARLMEPDSPMQGLVEARRRGWLRFVGVSGHQRVDKMAEAVRSGLVDVIMAPINFVDQHTYGYETRVLPEARKQRCGIVAMKVLGGTPGFQYRQPTPCMMPKDRVEDAIRYALGTRDVTTAVIGFNFVEQLRTAVRVAKSLRPLTKAETEQLAVLGKELAETWRLHMGPA